MNISNPLVSVIIPVYNTKKYLRRCLNSVQGQTYQNLEIIIINDGSTDNSINICEEFRKKDERVVVVSQVNKGLSAARNTGIDICHGDFITFVDSDDSIEKNYTKYLLELVSKGESDIAICAHEEVRREKVICNFGKGFLEKQYSTEECLQDMLNEKGFTLSSWGKLYDKKLFKNIRFPEGKLHEDIGTTYKLIMNAKKISYGPEPKYIYYLHNNSITSSGFNKQKLDIITQTDEMCKEILRRFPKMTDTILARKIHSRFSVLRLMVNEKNIDEETRIEKKKITNFLKNHRVYIAKSPSIPKRTKVAMKALSLGEPVFKLSWKIYSKFFK